MKVLSLACSLLSGIFFSQSSMIFKVEKDNIKPSYIYLNTITCGENEYLKSLEKDVLPNIEVISVESNINSDKNKSTLQNLIQLSDNEYRMKNVLSASDYQKLSEYVKEKMRVSEQMLNMFKPFYVNAVLTSLDNPCGNVRGENIALVLEKYAEKKGLEYSEMLSVSEHIELLDKLPKSYWKTNVSYVLNNSDELKSVIRKRNEAYNKGNLSALKNIYNSETYFKGKNISEITEILLPKIEKQIQEKPTLFTIGVEYGLNDSNIITILKDKGYKITEIK